MGGDAADPTRLYAPEYGPIRRIAEYVLFYVVVDRLTRLLVELFTEFPPLATHAPTLELGSAIALVVVLLVVGLWEVRRQYRANPVDADDVGGLRPSARGLAIAGGALAVGAAIVASGWRTVVTFTGDPEVLMTVATEAATAVSAASGPVATAAAVLGTDLGVVVAFVAGFVLLAYGLDRLLIGLTREVLYRRYDGGPGRSLATAGQGD